MKSPGKPFVKGDPRCGRPRGARNKVPTGSIKAIFKHLADTSPELYEEAIKRGLRAREAKSCALIALAGAYIDGRPAERVQVDQTNRMFFIPGGSMPDMGSGE